MWDGWNFPAREIPPESLKKRTKNGIMEKSSKKTGGITMAYQVSRRVQEALDALTADPRVRRALAFMEEDQEEIIQRQMELALIPAPTFHEEKKAARLLELFRAEGLEDCHIDEFGNCVGIRRGTGGGKTVLLEGHMDTVFPLDTELRITREDGWIHCPGIVDDTRGCVTVLSTVRALNTAGIQTKGDVHVVGTVQEEGMGALRGMEYYVNHHPELEASVSIDGDGFRGVIYRATGIQTAEITFKGKGGHAYIAFGEVANPIHAAARAIAKIAELKVPRDPKTTYAVTNLHAGNMSAVHAIPAEAKIVINFRSNTPEELEKLRTAIFAAIDEACREETEFWGKDEITYECKYLCDVPAGTQDDHAPIVEAAVAASRYLGCQEPAMPSDGCTNCNRAIQAGLPAVCLGEGDYDPHIHSVQERFREEGAYKGCQQALLVTLLCAGTEEGESVL